MTPIGSIQLNNNFIAENENYIPGFIYVLWEGAIDNNEEYNHI